MLLPSWVEIENLIYLKSYATKFYSLMMYRSDIKIKSAVILFKIIIKLRKTVTTFSPNFHRHTTDTLLLMAQCDRAAPIFMVNVKYFSPLTRTKGTPWLRAFRFLNYSYICHSAANDGRQAKPAWNQHLLQSV